MKFIDKYKTYPYASIHRNVVSQQYGIVTNWDLCNAARSSKNFIQRLQKWSILEGHTGCVNTVSWNSSGTLLLSGSDDYMINIYDIYSEKMLHSIESGHRANIFSAKFLPCTSDMKIVSCSGDGMLYYNELGSNYGENFFNCHSGTTYEVLVTPGDPNTFLSCGEDGTVRLFDLRTKTKCHCQECSEDILIDTRHAVTSISINPLSPYHLAAGCKDSYVRVFDRRTLGTSVNTRSVNRNRGWMPGLFCKFKPEKLRKDASCRITSLRYSNDGSNILVSYCTDYIYTFSVNDSQGKYMDTKETKSDNGYHTNGTKTSNSLDYESEGLPPVKRLRLRGDWSDTGPQARPETAEESVPENNLMQRMSELFSRWLEDAISSPLERENSYGSNTSLDNEAGENRTENEELNSQEDNSSQNNENNGNYTNDDQENAAHVETSDEPNSNVCPLETSMDSVDENWMLCSTDDETNEPGNNDNKNSNENNCNENNCNENIVNKVNHNECNSNDSNYSNESHNNGNSIDENKKNVELTFVCESEAIDTATTSSQLNDISESSKSFDADSSVSCSANTAFLNEAGTTDCNSASINIIEESDVDTIKSDSFLNERTLWPDDFNTVYSSDNDDLTNETNTTGQSSCKNNDSSVGGDSSMTRSMEMTPLLSANRKKTTNHGSSLSLDPINDEKPKEHVTCKKNQTGSQQLDVNQVTEVEDQFPVNVDQVQSVFDNNSSVVGKTKEETTILYADYSVKECSVVNNGTDQGNNENNNQENVISLSNLNRQQADLGNVTDEQSDQIKGECTDVNKADKGSLVTETNLTDNKRLHGNISQNDSLDRNVTDKEIDPLNESKVKRQDIQPTTSTPNSELADESAIANQIHSTNMGDGMDSEDVQSVVNMEVVSEDAEIDSNLDVAEASSISDASTRRNELLYRVMQQSSHDTELSHSTEDLSGDTERLSNDIEESSNHMDTDTRESLFDATDESQGSTDNLNMRERAATRIQKFLRLNRSKFNSSEESYDRDVNPVFMPTKYSIFKGHRNARTMIKEANFWGDDYVLSGSDCGRIFIWDRHTGDLVMLLQGDSHVVNCVQPHPFDPILASSGIDHDVKIWAPLAKELPDLTDMGEIVNRNEQMLEESRDTITVPASFVLRMLASFGSRRRRRPSYRRIDDEENTEDTES